MEILLLGRVYFTSTWGIFSLHRWTVVYQHLEPECQLGCPSKHPLFPTDRDRLCHILIETVPGKQRGLLSTLESLDEPMVIYNIDGFDSHFYFQESGVIIGPVLACAGLDWA